MKLSDFFGVFKKNTIQLLSKSNPVGDNYVFDFTSDTPIEWKAGQHGVFIISDKEVISNTKGKKFRPFSVASVSEQGIIRIATRIGKDPSPYKQYLLSLEKEGNMVMRGPFGWFYLQNNHSPIVLVAGGIGITPYMAILQDLVKQQNGREVYMLYVAKDTHLFKDEVVELCQHINRVSLQFFNSSAELKTALDNCIEQYRANAYYYLSGKMSMIRALKKQIKANKISRKKIIVDPFYGY